MSTQGANIRSAEIPANKAFLPWQLGRNGLNVKLEKIQELTKNETTFSHRVRFTDLDVNKHVIASRYMEWILDSYPTKVLEEKELKKFEINFTGEAKLDDEISVYLASLRPLCSGSAQFVVINIMSNRIEIDRIRLVYGFINRI